METVEILTGSGERTGSIVSRNEVHGKGLWHGTVHIWIRDINGDLLFQKRALSKKSHPGLWDISCAGHISAGDTSCGAAVREMMEELGIKADTQYLRPLFTVKQQYINSDNTLIDNEITDVYLYGVPIRLQEILVDAGEVAGICFFPSNILKSSKLKDRKTFVQHDEEYVQLSDIL